MTHTRHFVCIAIATAPAANMAAWKLGIDPQKKLNTFMPNANAAGGDAAATATHCAVMGRMPDSAYAAIKANKGNLLPARWWSLNDDSGPDLSRCFASWDGSHVGEVITFDACLKACGLQRRIVPITQ